MLGHHHVSYNRKVITPPDLLQHLQEQIAILFSPQQGASLITACGDEMQISGAVIAMEPPGHC